MIRSQNHKLWLRLQSCSTAGMESITSPGGSVWPGSEFPVDWVSWPSFLSCSNSKVRFEMSSLTVQSCNSTSTWIGWLPNQENPEVLAVGPLIFHQQSWLYIYTKPSVYNQYLKNGDSFLRSIHFWHLKCFLNIFPQTLRIHKLFSLWNIGLPYAIRSISSHEATGPL